ncbi:amidohydrolase family protein [Curtobacterium sp. DN_7.5]|uniref:amidohydrolase family protein n=1 Tax=Curtobacterium sp. DN_7.5 TaxID=3049047 RepID=UPI001F595E48|nr:amidohydrolase family protein [Curtobacterium sp. DN_7.5]
MIIDAHHHLWDPADRPYPWMADDGVAALRRRFDVDDLRTATADSDVTATIVVQAAHDPGETAFLLAQPAPVTGVVGWVDLTTPDVADRLAALVDDGRAGPALVGIRHQAHDEPDPGWLARPDVVRGVRAVAAAGLAFDMLVRAREHTAALALVDAVPEARFVLDHAGKPDIAASDAGWQQRMADYAARPNVVCKLSGLLTEAGPDWRERPVARYAREVVEVFGPDRTAFGSDWPVSTLAARYSAVLGTTRDALADLTDDERDAVFRRTAEATYLAPRGIQT